MSARKLVGILLVIVALRPLQAGGGNLLILLQSLLNGDTGSGPSDFSSLVLTGLLVFIISALALIGLVTFIAGLRYVRGASGRLAGYCCIAANLVVALAAMSEGPQDTELLIWGGYLAGIVLAGLLLLLPAGDNDRRELN